MNNSWGSFIGAIRKPPWITNQWNYLLYLRFGLPFKMATSMSDFAKVSDLFGINKFKEFQVDVLNKLLELLLTPVVTLGRKVLVPGGDLNQRPSVHRSPALPTDLAGQRLKGLVPAILHHTILSKKIPEWCHWDWRVFYCNMQFHWKKIGLPCLMHIHDTEILLVKFPMVCMECNGIKYSGCRRWVYSSVKQCLFVLMYLFVYDIWKKFLTGYIGKLVFDWLHQKTIVWLVTLEN